MQRTRLAVLAAIGAAALPLYLGSTAAFAQAFPTKPVRLIVPFAAGGTTDIIARVVAPGLGAALGQQVVVENKGGAGGAIGALEMIKSTPNGHVLGMATVSGSSQARKAVCMERALSKRTRRSRASARCTTARRVSSTRTSAASTRSSLCTLCT